jgi:hypothetical protein
MCICTGCISISALAVLAVLAVLYRCERNDAEVNACFEVGVVIEVVGGDICGWNTELDLRVGLVRVLLKALRL